MVERRPFGLSLLAVSNVLLSVSILIGGVALLFSFLEGTEVSPAGYFVIVLFGLAILGLSFVCGVAGVDIWRLRKRGRSPTILLMSMLGFYAWVFLEDVRIPNGRPVALAPLLAYAGVLAYSIWAVVYLLLPKTRRRFVAASGSVQSGLVAADKVNTVSDGSSVTRNANIPAVTPNGARWRRVVSFASLASAICIISAHSIQTLRTADLFSGLLAISPCWLPYVFIFFRLRGEQPKTGLSLAIAMGCAVFAPAISVLWYAHQWQGGLWIQGFLLLLAMLQPLLIGAAILANNSLPARPRDRLKLATSIAYGVVLSLGFWLFVHYGNLPTPIESNEHSAMESLRSVYMAAAVYARDHGGSFPESAATWESQDGCRAYYWTAANHVVDGYSFDYRGEPSDKTVEGCRVAKNYAATARPVVFGKTGRRSFFVDQTGVIRCTSENRAATANDLPIPPGSLPPL